MKPLTTSPGSFEPTTRCRTYGSSDDLNTATLWKKKGGCLRAASISNRFLLTIDEEKVEAFIAKAVANLDRLRVYQYLTGNLGTDSRMAHPHQSENARKDSFNYWLEANASPGWQLITMTKTRPPDHRA